MTPLFAAFSAAIFLAIQTTTTDAVKCYTCMNSIGSPCTTTSTVDADYCMTIAASLDLTGENETVYYNQDYVQGDLLNPSMFSWSKWTYGMWGTSGSQTQQALYFYICKDRDYCNGVPAQKPQEQVLPEMVTCKNNIPGSGLDTCKGHFCIDTLLTGETTRYKTCGYGRFTQVSKNVDLTHEHFCQDIQIVGRGVSVCVCAYDNCNAEAGSATSSSLPVYECQTEDSGESGNCYGHYCLSLNVHGHEERVYKMCQNVTDSLDCEVGLGCTHSTMSDYCVCKGHNCNNGTMAAGSRQSQGLGSKGKPLYIGDEMQKFTINQMHNLLSPFLKHLV